MMSAPASTRRRANSRCAAVGHVRPSWPQCRKTTSVSVDGRALRTAATNRSTFFADANPPWVSDAVHVEISASSMTWVAPMIAMRWPCTVRRYGAYAWSASAPMPTTGKRVTRIASSESWRPTVPKSIPWLLAIVVTSTPPDASAVNADAGARNVNSLGWGVPRSVIAVSRLTIAMSADSRTGAIGASTVAGFAASKLRKAPSKCTSLPNASTTGRRFTVVVVTGRVVGEDVGTLATGALAGGQPARDSARPAECPDEQAAASTIVSARTTRAATTGPRTAAVIGLSWGAVRTLPPMTLPRLSPAAFRRLTLVNVVLLVAIIVSGAIVRLTNSGLGCANWPNCSATKLVDVSTHHAAIEQLNRIFSG